MKGSFLVSDILRDACWVSEVTLKGSRIVSEPAPCGWDVFFETQCKAGFPANETNIRKLLPIGTELSSFQLNSGFKV